MKDIERSNARVARKKKRREEERRGRRKVRGKEVRDHSQVHL